MPDHTRKQKHARREIPPGVLVTAFSHPLRLLQDEVGSLAAFPAVATMVVVAMVMMATVVSIITLRVSRRADCSQRKQHTQGEDPACHTYFQGISPKLQHSIYFYHKHNAVSQNLSCVTEKNLPNHARLVHRPVYEGRLPVDQPAVYRPEVAAIA